MQNKPVDGKALLAGIQCGKGNNCEGKPDCLLHHTGDLPPNKYKQPPPTTTTNECILPYVETSTNNESNGKNDSLLELSQYRSTRLRRKTEKGENFRKGIEKIKEKVTEQLLDHDHDKLYCSCREPDNGNFFCLQLLQDL